LGQLAEHLRQSTDEGLRLAPYGWIGQSCYDQTLNEAREIDARPGGGRNKAAAGSAAIVIKHSPARSALFVREGLRKQWFQSFNIVVGGDEDKCSAAWLGFGPRSCYDVSYILHGAVIHLTSVVDPRYWRSGIGEAEA
jgi:hypothetical protein